jgi:hypothetical protein
MPKTNPWIRLLVGIGSVLLWILSLPFVRNFVWGKVMKKGQEKIVEAQAKIVNKG